MHIAIHLFKIQLQLAHHFAGDFARDFNVLRKGEQHHKFISAPARQHIGCTQVRAENVAHINQ